MLIYKMRPESLLILFRAKIKELFSSASPNELQTVLYGSSGLEKKDDSGISQSKLWESMCFGIFSQKN